MKIKEQHYLELKEQLQKKLKTISHEQLERGIAWIKSNPKVKNVELRFVWDLFYALPQDFRSEFTSSAYEYLHDEHITTALKSIIKECGISLPS